MGVSMIASTHLAAGALNSLLIQKYLPKNSGVIKRIGAGFSAGLISHIALDAIPHQEYSVEGYKLGSILLVEILAVFCLVFYSTRTVIMNWILFLGMSGAAFPDLLNIIHKYGFKWGWLYDVENLLHVFHGNPNAVYKIDILSQLLLASLFLFGIWIKK